MGSDFVVPSLILLIMNLQVINKFFQIRQCSQKEFEDTSWDVKCTCLMDDSDELWSFNDASTSKYIVRFQNPDTVSVIIGQVFCSLFWLLRVWWPVKRLLKIFSLQTKFDYACS
jgi:hypothetical protein